MDRYALVDDATDAVLNVIVWDGASGWAPPDGIRVVRCDDVIIDRDWLWNDGTPQPPVYVPRYEEDTSATLVAEVQRLQEELASTKAELGNVKAL
tara:strand:- start:101 stop:385 length:285 start_codon:yes stop_codon:yes gene_type:complete